jgi:hypothetical protein
MVVVYAHPNGADYVAEVDGDWLRWPAERNGWEHRQPSGPAEAEWDELPEPLSTLALRLSGGPE